MSASRQAVTNAISSPDDDNGPRRTLTDDGYKEFVETLRTMRGAALKIGQWMSLQEESMLPAPLAEALRAVHSTAHHMPLQQLEQQMARGLGAAWRDRFDDFPDTPIAAASIGQVHHARLKKPCLSDGNGPGADEPAGSNASIDDDEEEECCDVAVKVQYPGVADSIDSDLRNLQTVTRVAGFLPRGLFVDNIIRVGRRELTAECNYEEEAAHQARFVRSFVRSFVGHDSHASGGWITAGF